MSGRFSSLNFSLDICRCDSKTFFWEADVVCSSVFQPFWHRAVRCLFLPYCSVSSLGVSVVTGIVLPSTDCILMKASIVYIFRLESLEHLRCAHLVVFHNSFISPVCSCNHLLTSRRPKLSGNSLWVAIWGSTTREVKHTILFYAIV